MSPGIPCIYYGTEQGFDGSGDGDKYVREAMFGSPYGAFRSTDKHFFNTKHPVFVELSRIIRIRNENLALRQGRIYQREISYNHKDFALPHKMGEDKQMGVIVWSRILSHQEIVLAINCDLEHDRTVDAMIDASLHTVDEVFECLYSPQPSQIGSTVSVAEVMGRIILPVTVPQSGCVVYRKKDKEN
jgi:glycosidase